MKQVHDFTYVNLFLTERSEFFVLTSFRDFDCMSVCLSDHYGYTVLPTVMTFGINVPTWYIGGKI